MRFRISDFGFRISHLPTPGSTKSSSISKFEIPKSKSGEAGYTLVIFVMVIAIMAIMLAAAVQIVSFQAQREKEAELIFRGQQYVEGIRLFRAKFGRYPMRMKELWEADPKVLRKKWIDPITGSEEWGLVFQGQEGRELTVPGGGGARPTPTRTPVFERQREAGGEKVGPIIGVHSLSTDTSIKVYEGRTQYDMWKFVLREDSGAAAGGGSPWGERPTPEDEPGDGPPWPEQTGTPGY
jgi:type II secretory pathway pseudopilin PulG